MKTKAEIQAAYTTLATQYGDLAFNIGEVEAHHAALVQQKRAMEEQRQQLLKDLKEAVDEPGPALENQAG